jgi:hypothetical protein
MFRSNQFSRGTTFEMFFLDLILSDYFYILTCRQLPYEAGYYVICKWDGEASFYLFWRQEFKVQYTDKYSAQKSTVKIPV